MKYTLSFYAAARARRAASFPPRRGGVKSKTFAVPEKEGRPTNEGYFVCQAPDSLSAASFRVMQSRKIVRIKYQEW